MRLLPSGILIASMVALVGCANPVDPRVVFTDQKPISGQLYLIAAKEKGVIRESLQRAGVDLAEDLVGASAMGIGHSSWLLA
jgi:hypothetical protein